MLKQSVRWASSRLSPKALQNISALVPKTGRVDLIGPEGVSRQVSLQSVQLSADQRLQVVNVRPTSPTQDPTVAVKILSASEHLQHSKKAKEQSQKKPKDRSSQVKDIIVSWLISRHDLDGQKRKAIESVLGRGHVLQLKLEAKKRPRKSPSATELEARQLLLEHVRALAGEYGTESKPAEGSLETRMTLFYRPKQV